MDYKSTSPPLPYIRRRCVRCSLRWTTFFIVFMSVVNHCHGIYRDCRSDGEYLACFPSTERILINTNTSITVEPADATCGLNGEGNQYLMLGDLHTVHTCKNGEHSADRMIDGGPDKLTTWWQSKTWTVEEYTSTSAFTIDITLSVKKKFRMSSDITLTFNSGRPQKMIIMKSADKGATWQDMQYYARKCTEEYPDAPTETASNLTAVICTEDYSRDTSNPQQGLQAVFPGANLRMAHLSLEEYYTEMEKTAMKEFLTFTDIRIRLLYPATDSQEATLNPLNFYRYYYAISDVDITGSCFCNLHSSGCVTDKITGESRCECQHNTAGDDCERCMDLYNNKPWKEGSYLPYPDGDANPCEKCECYDHSDSCTYNATYDEGVCNNCVHNTAGRKCDACLEGFYPDMTLPLNHSDVCPPCDCEPLGLLDVNDTSCVNDRSAAVVGQCTCKPLVTGRRCDACDGGYYGLLDPESPGTCKDCGCNVLGRSSNICDQTTGQCNCKDSIEGRICDTCKDGFFQFPVIASAECSSCRCDPGGSVNITCDNFGICTCIPHVTGPKCNLVEQNHYMRSVDEFLKQPKGGTCVIGGGAYSPTNPFDGEVFATCPKDAATVIFEELKGQEHQFEVSWSFVVGVRYTLLGSEPRSGNLHVQPHANTNIDFKLQESLCPVSFQIGQDRGLIFQPGVSESVSSGATLKLDRRCVYTVELNLLQNENASDIVIDSVVFMPNLSDAETGKSFRTLSESSDPTALTSLYGSCRDKMMSMIQRPEVINPGDCRDLLWSVSAEIYKQGTPCDCDATGSTSTSCASLGGKCPCKLGVGGRQCDACLPGYFALSASGCSRCQTLSCQNILPILIPKEESTKPPVRIVLPNGTEIPQLEGTREGTEVATKKPMTEPTVDNKKESEDETVNLSGMFLGLGLGLAAVFLACIAIIVLFPKTSLRKCNCFHGGERDNDPGIHVISRGPTRNLGSRDPRNIPQGDENEPRLSWMMQDPDGRSSPTFVDLKPELADGCDLPRFYMGQTGSPFFSKQASFRRPSDAHAMRSNPEPLDISVENADPSIDFSKDCEVDIIPPPPSFNTFKSDNPITLPVITVTKATAPKKPKRKKTPKTLSLAPDDLHRAKIDDYNQAVDENTHNENLLSNQRPPFADIDSFDEVNGSLV